MDMRRNGRDSNWKIDLQIPGLDQRMGFAAGIFAALFFLGGIFVWAFLFAAVGTGSILTLEMIINIIIFGVNLFAICRIGYDGFWKNLKVTYGGEIFLTVAGFYMGDIHFLTIPAGGTDLLYRFLEFLAFVIFSVFASILPSVLFCLVMWLVMSVFGKN